jgi:MFS family permease
MTTNRRALSETDLYVLLFVQMVPATVLSPAIRPLFAMFHGADERAMHAFMALNMLGGLLVAPLIGWMFDRRKTGNGLAVALGVTDALLLMSFSLPLPISIVLAARTLEGAAHVGVMSILLANASATARSRGDARVMGMAGASIVFAIAAGNALGAILVAADPRAPFLAGATMAMAVAIALLRSSFRREAPARQQKRFRTLDLLVPITAAFVERFSVGCIIVTFALFAHRHHHLADPTVGLLYFLMTLTFAFATWAVGRGAERIVPAAVLFTGALIYAAALAAFAIAPARMLAAAMIAAGAGAGMMFAPALAYASRLGGSAGRGRAMGLINAAGCLGMLLGPALAGILTSVRRDPAHPAEAYRLVFAAAAATVLLWTAFSARWLLHAFRGERRNREERRSTLQSPDRLVALQRRLHGS